MRQSPFVTASRYQPRAVSFTHLCRKLTSVYERWVNMGLSKRVRSQGAIPDSKRVAALIQIGVCLSELCLAIRLSECQVCGY
jgi:hypothetical protein